jgi:hypothetical protein
MGEGGQSEGAWEGTHVPGDGAHAGESHRRPGAASASGEGPRQQCGHHGDHAGQPARVARRLGLLVSWALLVVANVPGGAAFRAGGGMARAGLRPVAAAGAARRAPPSLVGARERGAPRGRGARGAERMRMMVDPSAGAALSEDSAALYLAVAGSLTGGAPLVLVDPSTLNLALGAFAGMVASAVVFPIDTAKTRIQASDDGDDKQNLNTWQTMKSIVETDGVSALYRGLVPVMVGAAPESAIQLTVFELAQNLLRKSAGMSPTDSSILVVTVAGMLAGTAQLIATNPLEVLKISAQTNKGAPKSSIRLIRELGLTGLFKGWQSTLFRDIPFAGVYFPLYIQAKSLLAPVLPSPLMAAMVSGLAAGMFAAGVTTPADVIKTNIQTSRAPASASDAQRNPARSSRVQSHARKQETPGDAGSKVGIISVGRQIYAKKGWAGFLSGIDARLSRQAPAQGVCLFVFECLKQVFREKVRIGSVFVAVSDDVTGVKYYSSGGGYSEAVGFVDGVSQGGGATGQLVPAIQQLGGAGPSVLTNIDVNLAAQSAETAAAAMTQGAVESVVVPMYRCSEFLLGSDAYATCINQGITQF